MRLPSAPVTVTSASMIRTASASRLDRYSMSRTAADYASSGMLSSSVGTGSSADTESNAAPGLGSPTEEIEARRPVPGSLAVQRSVHDLAFLQYHRMSAQACPPSGTIRSSGNAMPHSEHWVDCDGRGWSLRCLAIGAPIRESRGACNTRPGPPVACVAREATEAAARPRSNPGPDHRRSRGRRAHTRRCRRPGSGRPRHSPTGTAGPPRCRDPADRRTGPRRRRRTRDAATGQRDPAGAVRRRQPDGQSIRYW